MATDDIDPSLVDPVEGDQLPATEEPSPEATPTVEELQEQLAAAQNEVKTWKGRVEKATKSDKTEKQKTATPISEEDIDWKLANNSRVALVKDTYEKHLTELQELGAKLTPALKEKALRLAEDEEGIHKSTVDASSDPLPSPSIERSGNRPVRKTETDVALGVKDETIKEFRDYVEGV